MEYSGAGGKLIHENNQKQKSRATVPLSIKSTSKQFTILKRYNSVPYSDTNWIWIRRVFRLDPVPLSALVAYLDYNLELELLVSTAIIRLNTLPSDLGPCI
jgi:hypothetical protein